MQPQTPHAPAHPGSSANPSPQHLAASAAMQVAAAARYNRSGGPPRDGYGPPAGHPAHRMPPNGGGLEGQTMMMHPGQGPQGQARVMMVNGNVPNLGAGPLHQNGAGAPPTVIHTSDPMHPQHASWRASMEAQQQQQQQQAHYLRGPPGQPPLRVQTAFTGQQQHPGQGGPPNGMLPSPLPLNLPPNTRGPPSQNPAQQPHQPPPGARPPPPNPNHPAMPYRQQTGPPQPALPPGPPTPLPMRQPSAPPPPNGQPQQVDPRVAAQLALSGCVPSFRLGLWSDP